MDVIVAANPADFVGYAGAVGLAFGAWLSYRAQNRSAAAEFYDELVQNQGRRIQHLEQKEAAYEAQLSAFRAEISALRAQLATTEDRLSRVLEEYGNQHPD